MNTMKGNFTLKLNVFSHARWRNYKKTELSL